MYNDTCTLLNKTKTGMIKTILRGVHFESCKAVSVDKGGTSDNSTSTVIIPFVRSLTLRTGDLLVRGEVIEDGISQAEIEKKYGEVILITKIEEFCFGSKNLWHWEVSG